MVNLILFQKKLELNFLNFMKGVFESYNLSFFEGKEWSVNRNTKGEIDAVVVSTN